MLYQLFSSILDMALISCPVIIVILFVRGIMYPFPKKYRYFIWGIVGIRLICPFAVSSPASIFNLAGTVKMVTMEKEDSSKTDKSAVKNNIPVDSKIPSGFSGSLQDSVSINILKENKPSSSISVPVTGIEPFIKYGTFVWLAGIIIILSWNFYMVSGMKKHLERAVLFEGNIYECENIPSPFVLGILHPKIYIPFQLRKEEQKYILKHEKYHIMRKDYIIKPVSFLLACIYWFNPLVWISYFLMVRDMEMSCDEYVLQNMDASIRKDYSMSLLGFATNQRVKNAGLLSFGETDTRKRVVNVLNFKKHGKWIGVMAVSLILGAGAACLTNAYGADKEAVKKIEGKTINETGKKTGNEEKDIKNEALVANATIHGYDVQVVYIPDGELPDKADLEFGMYSGRFAIRTYKDNVKYAEYPLDFGINDMVYYPEEGFGLSVKDYNGDGENDDFALGQGQTPLPGLGNFMYYQFFNVDKNGNITRYTLSTKDGKSVITIPDEYSKDFKCKDGEITYQALTEDGVKKQAASVTMEIPVTDNYIFSDEDIQTAKKAVKSYFKKVFENCTIKKLWFDKDAYQKNVTYFSGLYGKDDIIILLSNFYVSKDYCKDNSLYKDYTYRYFMWVMSRNENEDWKVETYGY